MHQNQPCATYTISLTHMQVRVYGTLCLSHNAIISDIGIVTEENLSADRKVFMDKMDWIWIGKVKYFFFYKENKISLTRVVN